MTNFKKKSNSTSNCKAIKTRHNIPITTHNHNHNQMRRQRRRQGQRKVTINMMMRMTSDTSDKSPRKVMMTQGITKVMTTDARGYHHKGCRHKGYHHKGKGLGHKTNANAYGYHPRYHHNHHQNRHHCLNEISDKQVMRSYTKSRMVDNAMSACDSIDSVDDVNDINDDVLPVNYHKDMHRILASRTVSLIRSSRKNISKQSQQRVSNHQQDISMSSRSWFALASPPKVNYQSIDDGKIIHDDNDDIRIDIVSDDNVAAYDNDSEIDSDVESLQWLEDNCLSFDAFGTQQRLPCSSSSFTEWFSDFNDDDEIDNDGTIVVGMDPKAVNLLPF